MTSLEIEINFYESLGPTLKPSLAVCSASEVSDRANKSFELSNHTSYYLMKWLMMDEKDNDCLRSFQLIGLEEQTSL